MPSETVTLNDGQKIPTIAFGTGSIHKRTDVFQMVHQALEAGFWHLDTAAFYQNEEYVGKVIHESGLARSELYITTKYVLGEMEEEIQTSLSNLGLKYVDLYLINQPSVVPDIDGTWKKFEAIKKDGLAKSIGVSNFTLPQLKRLVKNALMRPAFNQIELHPYNDAAQKAPIKWSAQHGIVTEAYSSLSSITKFRGGPVDVPVAAAAARLGITPTQVLLSWVRAKGAVIVTTTSNKSRLEENLAVGDLPPLPPVDVLAIDAAGRALYAKTAVVAALTLAVCPGFLVHLFGLLYTWRICSRVPSVGSGSESSLEVAHVVYGMRPAGVLAGAPLVD